MGFWLEGADLGKYGEGFRVQSFGCVYGLSLRVWGQRLGVWVARSQVFGFGDCVFRVSVQGSGFTFGREFWDLGFRFRFEGRRDEG